MLYAMPRPASPVPFTVRDGPPFDYRFIEDLREFICLRLDKVNPYKESKEYCLQQEKASRLFLVLYSKPSQIASSKNLHPAKTRVSGIRGVVKTKIM